MVVFFDAVALKYFDILSITSKKCYIFAANFKNRKYTLKY